MDIYVCLSVNEGSCVSAGFGVVCCFVFDFYLMNELLIWKKKKKLCYCRKYYFDPTTFFLCYPNGLKQLYFLLKSISGIFSYHPSVNSCEPLNIYIEIHVHYKHGLGYHNIVQYYLFGISWWIILNGKIIYIFFSKIYPCKFRQTMLRVFEHVDKHP